MNNFYLFSNMNIRLKVSQWNKIDINMQPLSKILVHSFIYIFKQNCLNKTTECLLPSAL